MKEGYENVCLSLYPSEIKKLDELIENSRHKKRSALIRDWIYSKYEEMKNGKEVAANNRIKDSI